VVGLAAPAAFAAARVAVIEAAALASAPAVLPSVVPVVEDADPALLSEPAASAPVPSPAQLIRVAAIENTPSFVTTFMGSVLGHL